MVDPATLMLMGDHHQATAAEKVEMRDLCHEYQASGFSCDLKDLPGFRGMKVKLKDDQQPACLLVPIRPEGQPRPQKDRARRDTERQDCCSKETVGIKGGGQRRPHHQQPYSSGSDSRFRDRGNNRQRLLQQTTHSCTIRCRSRWLGILGYARS